MIENAGGHEVRPYGSPEVIAAGHVCLDIIPDLQQCQGTLDSIFSPGKLTHIGKVSFSPGGSVSNTGLALYRLGVATRLMGTVGEDVFGRALLRIFNGMDSSLSQGMIVSRTEDTSYSIVISTPGVDRLFLHHPGANDRVNAQSFPLSKWKTAKILHFGYPTIMRQIYLNEGNELVKLLTRAKELGMVTSLDLSLPDPDSEAGRLNWRHILSRLLPLVDLFLPSIDEVSVMLDLEPTAPDLHAEELLHLGAGIVVLKMGERGLYLKSSSTLDRLFFLNRLGYSHLDDWCSIEHRSPSFKVAVAGTTGAGDCAIAGFLTSLLKGLGPSEALEMAAAAGASSVEKVDATSGVPPWQDLTQRVEQGWESHTPETH